MDLSTGLPVIEIMINEKGPFRVAVDSGAPGAAHLNESVASSLKLQRIGEARSSDPSGKNPISVYLYGVDRIDVGDVTIKGWTASGSPPSANGRQGIDGVLGLDAFDGYVVTFDYPHGELRLDRGKLPPPDGRHVFGYEGPIPTVPLTIEGHQLASHLDTGNSRFEVMVPTDFAAHLKKYFASRAIGQAHTFNNTIDLRAVDLDASPTIGEVRVNAAAVAYPSVIPVGNVGSKALGSLVARIDPENKRVSLGPQSDSETSHAKVTINMGDGTVDGTILHPYDNTWIYTVTNEAGKVIPQGLWSDHLQMTKVGRGTAMLRVQGTTFVTGKTTSTVNVFNPVTLEPLSSRQQGINGEVRSRAFKGTHLTTTRTGADGHTAATEVELPAEPYDFNGGMYGLLLATMPLKTGYGGTFNTVEENEDKPAVDSFEVLGSETLSAGSRGTVRAWKVLSERKGRYRMTFWLRKKSPYIIKLQYQQDGSPLVFKWEMI
jgi:hypothetical protein